MAHRSFTAACRWAVVAASACVATTAPAANLFANGSFETPTVSYQLLAGGSTAITGWTTVLSGVEHYNAGTGAADGAMVVDLANYVYSNGGLEQSIATLAGQRYDVNFFAGNTMSSGRDGTGLVLVTIDGGTTLEFETAVATSANYAWAERSFSFVASDSSTTIRFWNVQNSFTHFALIDGVGAVQAVPEPAAALLLAAGLAGLGLLRRRRG
jgi:Protein of unknown function (DUF642)/PEP-CTERM motif